MLTRFYWGTIRKAIVAFGNLFNNIQIDRLNSDGSTQQSIKVPLSYSSKQSFLARIDQIPGPAEDRTQSVIIPRMGFEMIDIRYDGSRKLPVLQQNTGKSADGTRLNSQYVPTPYDLTISLYIYVKNMDDGLQIIEQIIPYFNPDFNLTMKAMPELDMTNDLPIVMESIEMEDNYEGDFITRQNIIWTLTFKLKVNFFGPITSQRYIKKTIMNLTDDEKLSAANILTRITSEVIPSTAFPPDLYEIVTTIEGFDG